MRPNDRSNGRGRRKNRRRGAETQETDKSLQTIDSVTHTLMPKQAPKVKYAFYKLLQAPSTQQEGTPGLIEILSTRIRSDTKNLRAKVRDLDGNIKTASFPISGVALSACAQVEGLVETKILSVNPVPSQQCLTSFIALDSPYAQRIQDFPIIVLSSSELDREIAELFVPPNAPQGVSSH